MIKRLTRHMCQTTKLHLILRQHIQFSIMHWCIIWAKLQNTPDFTTTYPIFLSALTRHMCQTTKLHLILTNNLNFKLERHCWRVRGVKLQNYIWFFNEHIKIQLSIWHVICGKLHLILWQWHIIFEYIDTSNTSWVIVQS